MYMFSSHNLLGQCTNPPNGVDCLCSTATLLCTPDLLDGFTFSMSATSNLGGYSNGGDLCPGNPQDGVPNNVNWFSFIAWCTDLEMDVYMSNCQAGSFNSFGAQIGLFAGCPPSSPIECITDGDDACGNAGNYPTLHNFNASGLIIGNVYYFMLDGCAGSTCDITIDVIGVCGTGMIDPWTTGVTGPLETCVGNTDTYFAEDLNGAVEFYYYLDGVLIDDGIEQTSTDITWTTAGIYELCVDVSNLPCIPESDMPAPYCITIEVCEEADAGDITLTTSPACPGDVVDILITNNTSGAEHDQYIIITDNTGLILDVIVGTVGDFTHDECDNFDVYSYNVKVGNAIPTVGTFFPTDYPCDDNCCDIESDEIVFEDNIAPVYTSPPADLMLECYLLLQAPADMAYTDNCVDPGVVSAVETGTADLCSGGILMRTWTVRDSCSNINEYSQSIDISPLDPPQFITTPSDLTFDCGYMTGTIPDLSYENTQGGMCFRSGTVPGNISGMSDICGGNLTIDWEYTDTCNNVIMHTQNITVDPAPEASWVNPPATAVTISCSDIPATIPDLDYDNGETGTCAIMGSVMATTINNYDECGGTITNSWTFTDECMRTITHDQVITIDPAPIASFQGTLPASITVSCDAVPAAPGDLTVSNGESGVCEITDIISPMVDDQSDPCGGFIRYSWDFTDNCSRNLNYQQVITIDPADPPAYTNPPTDITVDCDNIPSSGSSLDYTNGLSGSCELSGSTISVLSAFDVCTGIITETWDDVDACGNVVQNERQITVEPIDPIVFTNPPMATTMNCDEVPATFPALDYSNNASGPCLISGSAQASVAGSFDECGGTLVVSWTADDGCGVSIDVSQTITVNPATAPVFDVPPGDVTLNCEQVPTMTSLNYSNGESGSCDISGSVMSSQTGTYDACGGTINYEWEYTDDCGNTINEIQAITVDPAPMASYINPPDDITITCDDAGTILNTLNYSNNQTAPCSISGLSIAVSTGTYDLCGGAITQTWSFTDDCDRMITHSRVITVDPAADPFFVDPPDDVTLACGETYQAPTDLVVTNNETGICGINTTVSPMVTQAGIIYTHTWEYTNECDGSILSYIQTVTESPIPEISIDPIQVNICLGDAFDLSTINVVDANGTNITLTYFLGNPVNPSAEIFDPVVNPVISSLYTILATNEYGCTDEAIFSIVVDQPPNAGEDGETSICDNITINLFDFLGPTYDLGGAWLDVDGTGIDLENPSSVVFSNLAPGSYDYSYTVTSGNTCPDDEATVTVTFNQLGELVVDSIFCTGGNEFYTVILQDLGYSILPNFGSVESQSNGITTIVDIPIGNAVTINFFDPTTFCASFIVINPPNCDCPQVPMPTAENLAICASAAPGVLEAIAADGTTLNWYDVAVGGTALITNSESFTSPAVNPGVYTYYVEAESIEFPGCVSSIRLLVSLTITASPVINEIPAIEFCLTEGESIEIIFAELNTQLNNNPNNTFEYYESQEDADAGMGEITSAQVSSSTSYFIKVSNSIGCSTIGSFDITINPNPILEIDITHESCAGEADGSISISAQLPSSEYSVILDGNPSSGFDITDLTTGIHILEVTENSTTCSVLDTFTINPGAEIVNQFLEFACDDNGTDTDPDDDFYTLEFNFDLINGSGTQYEFFVEGTSQGTYNYGELISIMIPTNASTIILEAVDLDSNCSWTQSIGPLNPCSTNCSLTVNSLSQICDNNGTPSDNSDDFIVFALQVSAINGSASNTYTVSINSIPQYTFNYDEESTFSLNADGTTPSILIVDAADIQCSLPLTILPLIPCSNDCLLDIEDFTAICSDNGTEDNIDDDFYTISIMVDILNGSGSGQVNVSIDNNPSVLYTIGMISFDMPADELTHTIYVQDSDSLTCIDSIVVGPLDPCSSDCSLNFSYYEEVCNDNGTPFDSSDDFYDLSWFLTSIEGSPDSMYLLYIDEVFIAFYEYSTDVNYTIPADGMVHILEFVDVANEFCNENVQTSTLVTCSDSCLIDYEIIEITCDNNGTNITELDDIFFVDINVSILNGSTTWQWVETGEFFSYGSNVNLGPFNIMDGSFVINILDSLNLTCPISVEIIPPLPCSECTQFVEAGADQEIDCDMPAAELIATSSAAGSYVWEGPLGVISEDSIASGTAEGWYYFTATYSDGCTATDSLFVDALVEIPIAIAGPDSTLTCLVDNIILTGQYIGNSNNVSYVWRNSAGDIVSTDLMFTVSTSGLYTFEVIDNETGCISEADPIFIGLDIEQPEAIIYADPGNILNCLVELITLSPEGEDNTIYEWIDNGVSTISNSYVITTTGTVVLVAIDTLTGCLASDSIQISQLVDFPIINIDPYEILTCDNETVVLSAANSIPSTTSVFTWYDLNLTPLGTEPSYTVNQEGFYVIEVQDTITGCINADTIQVTLDQTIPEIVSAEDVALPCDETQTDITAIVDNPAESDFLWTVIEGNIISNNLESTITAQEGVYIVEVTNTVTGCSVIDTVEITEIDNNVDIDGLTAESESCQGEGDGYVNWNQIVGGTEPYELYLNDELQADTDIIQDLVPGIYSIEVIDANGCSFVDQFTINPGLLPSSSTDPTLLIDQGDSGQITVETNIPLDSILSIIWDPSDFLSCDDCLDPVANPPTDQLFTVTITDVNGCETTTQINVVVRAKINIYVPNTFTPNDDGINDVFTIYSNSIEEIQILRVYNRWGELVFENNNFPPNTTDFGWNGTFKGRVLNPGVYAYYSVVLTTSGTTEVLKGDVTIIK